MNRALMFFAALLFLFVGGAFFKYAMTNGSPNGGSVAETDAEHVPLPKTLTEFEFTDQLAKPFGSKQLEGKVWMASFFFASCPGICVQQNREIAKVHKRFADEDVFILNISVQPDTDVPHKLFLYGNKFDANHEKWKFLTGKDIEYVRLVGAEFFSLPAADETHTSEVALFDHEGTMYGPYKATDPQEQTKLIMKTEELLEKCKAATAGTNVDGEPESQDAVAQES